MAIETGLEGQRVLVTGASGGIGDAIAELFAAEGCRLILHANSRVSELDKRAKAAGWNAVTGSGDLKEPKIAQALVEQGIKQFGGVDICIANAGVWPVEDVSLADMSVERIRDCLEINLLGALWTAKAFLAGLKRRSDTRSDAGASLCMIGSTAAQFGEAGHCDYAVSKAGMYGMLRTLKNEIVHEDRYGRVNLVEPGWTVTEMAEAALAVPGAIEKSLQSVPMQQLARPVDIARAVLSLSSPYLSRHVSGQTITVAGGMEGRVQWQPQDIDSESVLNRLK